MPIAKLESTNPSPIKVNVPKSTPPTYKTVTIDEKVLPKSQLLAYISGSVYIVDYYQQVIGRSDSVKEYDLNQGHIYQQYNLIEKLELRVESPLASNFDDETNTTTINGSALMYPSIIPNVGDAFIAECGQGRVGLFNITRTERKTFNRESVFSIEYVCTSFMDMEPEKFSDIKSKVIRQYVFNKDRLIEGGVGVLTREEDNNYVLLKDEYKKLVKYYMKAFFEDDINTLSIPGQRPYTYDHFVTEFLLKIVGVEEFSTILKTRLVNIENDKFMRQQQLYSMLIDRNYDALDDCNKVMRLIPTSKNFSWDATLNSLRYSKIRLLVYPMDYDVTGLYTDYLFYRKKYVCRFKEVIDYYNLLRIKLKDKPKEPIESENEQYYLIEDELLKFEKLVEKHDNKEELDNIIMLEPLEHQRSISHETIKPITIDDYYVFSKNFYDDTPEQSLLETLTLDYLKCKDIDSSKLINVVKECKKWGKLEQFYYIPIVILLIKSTKISLH